jgi:hypothetical protein
VVIGPGVPAGAKIDAMAENIDLAKTFTAIGGTTLPGDGHSLLGLLQGRQPAGWRNAVLVEHLGIQDPSDVPDFQEAISGNPATNEAMRTPTFLYVEYTDHTREYYDLTRDPFEIHNIVHALTLTRRLELHRDLAAIVNCHGGDSCWSAMHAAPGP